MFSLLDRIDMIKISSLVGTLKKVMPKKSKTPKFAEFAEDPFGDFVQLQEPVKQSISREQIELFGGDETPSKEVWRKNREVERMRKEKERRRTKDKHTEEACIRVCFFVPQLPESGTFRRWLPKHRHILFGHFGYWICASLITASTGTSLKTKCSTAEPVIMFLFLILTSFVVSLAKFFGPGGVKKTFGPTIVSFLMMFATGLSLHQKPLVCGFTNNSRRISIREQNQYWGIIVSLQVVIMLVSMLCYVMWHLKHKDEKREAELAGDASEKSLSSDEDSMQGSPASVRWTRNSDNDLESNNSEL